MGLRGLGIGVPYLGSWFHYLGTSDITWLLHKVPPHPGVGEGVFSRGEVVLLKVRTLSPDQVGYLQPAGLLDWAQSPPLPPGFSPDLAPAATLHWPAIWK